MSDTAERLRGATRWSMAARCARQASYGLLGVEPTPPTPRDSGRMARGRDAGAYFARQMAAKHGEDDVVFEAAVPWPAPPALPIGELHTDVEVKSLRLAVEVKNSIWVDSMYDSAVLQLAGALHFGRDRFDSGLLVFMDHDYQITDQFPIFLTDELSERVEEIASAVVEVGKQGPSVLPERVCGKPADGIGHFCPFIEHCFADWEAPEPTERDDFSVLASEGFEIQIRLKSAKDNEEAIQAEWDAWKERAVEATEEMPPGLEILAGPIKMKRIDVKGRETFSVAKARTAGMWTPAHAEFFHAFTKIGKPSVRFDLTKTEAEAPLDIDFGEEAPF